MFKAAIELCSLGKILHVLVFTNFKVSVFELFYVSLRIYFIVRTYVCVCVLHCVKGKCKWSSDSSYSVILFH